MRRSRFAAAAFFLGLLGACEPPPVPCFTPPYQDLSLWHPRAARLVDTCNRYTRAEVAAPAHSARSLSVQYAGATESGLWVTARVQVLAGVGTLSAWLLECDRVSVIGMSGPGLSGYLHLFGPVSSAPVWITFLGQAAESDLIFVVEDVLFSEIQITAATE